MGDSYKYDPNRTKSASQTDLELRDSIKTAIAMIEANGGAASLASLRKHGVRGAYRRIQATLREYRMLGQLGDDPVDVPARAFTPRQPSCVPRPPVTAKPKRRAKKEPHPSWAQVRQYWAAWRSIQAMGSLERLIGANQRTQGRGTGRGHRGDLPAVQADRGERCRRAVKCGVTSYKRGN